MSTYYDLGQVRLATTLDAATPTTLSGLLKAEGGHLAEAVAGQDYLGLSPFYSGKAAPQALAAPLVRVTSSLTLLPSHSGCLLYAANSGDMVLTIPASGFELGAELEIFRAGSGGVTIAPANATVSIHSRGGLRGVGQVNTSVRLKLAQVEAGATTWLLWGDLGGGGG